MIANVKMVYEAMSSQEASRYAFAEMTIKNWDYFFAACGAETGNEILEEVTKILEHFIGDRGFLQRIYRETFHFLILFDENPDKELDDQVLDAFLSELVDQLFDIPYPLLFHNVYTSFGILPPWELKGTYEELVNKASIIRTNCPELMKRSFCFEVFTEGKYQRYLNHIKQMRCITHARTHDHFIYYIQPKIDLLTNKIIGGEVLLRWKDESGKVIPTNEYIPYLSTFGEIYLIDLKTYRSVCTYLKEGLDQHQARVPMSFNICANNFSDHAFVNDYLSITEEIGVPHSYIEFEFMEDIKFDQGNHVFEIIQEFKEAGFSCSIDDFGRGNSSFAVLINSDLDIIKLDRLFFKEPLDEKRKQMIIHLVGMIKEMGMKVLAEGVETQEYVDFLKSIACDYIQGFYYYKPMPLEEFQVLLDQQHSQEVL
ncbi:MAG: EAL domain-containing protein [Beduini sp.]|uniref:EAL domain-containing protein n=1 Tax=Beduini sp. TaxID=1922300 RepID=UPI0039A2AADE